MQVKLHTEHFPYVIVNDFYDEKELSDIWTEINHLGFGALKTPKESGSAIENGEYLKQNKACWLDKLYTSERNASAILTHNRKIFHEQIVNVAQEHWFFGSILHYGYDATLLSYYENKDKYKSHRDATVITGITHLYKEPKMFDGGDLHFPQFDVTIPVENNRLILFPSQILHEATTVYMDTENHGKGLGRWTISQFVRHLQTQ